VCCGEGDSRFKFWVTVSVAPRPENSRGGRCMEEVEQMRMGERLWWWVLETLGELKGTLVPDTGKAD
jgi:hypothetical protein